jgi:glycosyltransferase involved in cell wall biosynthesis
MSPRRTLILLAKRPDPQLPARIEAGDEPKAEYLELARALKAEINDFHSVESSSAFLVKTAAQRMSPSWGLAALGLSRRKEFDHLYATGEDIGIPLAMLLKAARCHEKLTVVFHNIGTPKRRAVLKAIGHKVYRHIIVLGTSQRDILVNDLGIPSEKVLRLEYWCDHRFYTNAAPKPPEACDYVLSVGMESRDYPTLQTAATGLPVRFHVVASGWSPGAGYGAAAGISGQSNITVGRGYSSRELRDLYAGARFVVVPLKHVSYAAGVTAIVEGMSMQKGIVASSSPGILDYVRDGKSGLLVPVGDAEALRKAVMELWENPARLAELGPKNRAWIDADINTERYVARVAELLS